MARRPVPPESERQLTLSSHPRARNGVRRARALGGLVAFTVVAVAVYSGQQDLFQAAWKALLAGVVGMVISWRLAQDYWRIALQLAYKPSPQPDSDDGPDRGP